MGNIIGRYWRRAVLFYARFASFTTTATATATSAAAPTAFAFVAWFHWLGLKCRLGLLLLTRFLRS